MDRAVGDKAPSSVPSDWADCSCDKSRCRPLEDAEGDEGKEDSEEDGTAGDDEYEDDVEDEDSDL